MVFSAHGVSPEVHRQAEERSLKTIDATCPLVTKVHHEAKRFAGEDYDILLIGHAGHEEVEGTAGEAPDHIQLVQSPADVPGIVVRDPKRVAWLSQTTLSVDETLETVAAIRERFPDLLDPPSDDICYATQNRQLAVKEISPSADLVIVVGSGNSSNSVRLVEVALEAGAKCVVPRRRRLRDRRGLARRRPHRQRHLGRERARGAGRRRAGLPGRARLPRRPGGAQRRGVADLRAPARAAPRPQGRRPGLSRMARYLDVHPDNPQPRLLGQIADALRDDQLIAYPTDSGYALGCRLGNRDGRDRILRDPRPRRPAPLHADVQGLRAARPVRAGRQRGVPGDQGGDAGSLHVHPPGHPGGAAAADAPEEEDRRRPHPRPRLRAGAARRRWASRC